MANPSSQVASDGTKTSTGDEAGTSLPVPAMPDPTVKADQEPDNDQSEPLPDRPEGLTREDGASEPMSQPDGDQENEDIIPKGVISPYAEDRREVFERPVDDQPEWPADRQSGSVNDGAPGDRTTTQPLSSHEVKSAPGNRLSVAGGPKRSAGKTLTKNLFLIFNSLSIKA